MFKLNKACSLHRPVLKQLLRCSAAGYKQVKHMAEVTHLAEMEEAQRSEKYLVYTDRVYKPSKTITFSREGEVLLFSNDNYKNNQLYLKYPYCMIDAALPLAGYNFFFNPLGMDWLTKHTLFHLSYLIGWYPHWSYINSLYLNIYKIFLMRGGKYCRVELMTAYGEITTTYLTNAEISLLSADKKRFEDSDSFEFLTEEGQLKEDLNVQLDYLIYHGSNYNDELVKFQSTGTVHSPELFEAVMRGYNVDTKDFEINTEDNIRFKEGHKNY